MATSKRISSPLLKSKAKLQAIASDVAKGGLLTRLIKVVTWLFIGRLDDEQKEKLVTFLEKLKEDAAHVEITANKSGEVSLKFRKEF